MDKQQMLEKTVQVLEPFESSNLMKTLQTLTFAQVFSNPAVLIFIILVIYFGIQKKSMVVLLTLFFLFSMIIVIRYAMPVPGQELTMSSILPFVGAGITIGGVIIYFTMIKS